MINRLSNAQHWARIFSKDGEILGFLAANTSTSQTKGTLSRPMVTDGNLDYLPLMLQEAAKWLSQQGKTTVQMTVADERQSLMEQLQGMGWTKIHSWIQLVKRLDKSANHTRN